MKHGFSEQECFDVSSIMSLMADRKDVPPEYGAVMKRGASLLRRAVGRGENQESAKFLRKDRYGSNTGNQNSYFHGSPKSEFVLHQLDYT